MDELKAALELATEEELQQITQILFQPRFNPLDYWQNPQPLEIQSQNWDAWINSLDRRFRYLAADGFTVLRGNTNELPYRKILIQVCLYLKIPYSQQMSTTDIEAEIFLNLVSNAWKKLPLTEQKSLQAKISNALAEKQPPTPLPLHIQHNPVKILMTGGSLIAVNSILKKWLLKHIAQQLAIHFARYQAAKTALVKGGTLTLLQSKFALNAAKKGMTTTVARYGATKTVLSLMGSVMWAWLIADLGWRAIATNYSRIVPIIFTLAQIRLTRGDYCFAN
ncbi:conserved hypothetical protein [Hyella patelloides LEGE 07179]|uniref:Uncharacterized protein n=1 Tax=Hyella patelloides LEGE 07179 TaxID=945734 RepID=A0A563W0S5_9CYAN|nr:YaaW family protein [Hyella patelloides]VEP17312.1 conserved hypothetical protein [Hyella patelloides LEGE 07179]